MNENGQKVYGSRTWVHEMTSRLLKRTPNFKQNYLRLITFSINEL